MSTITSMSQIQVRELLDTVVCAAFESLFFTEVTLLSSNAIDDMSGVDGLMIEIDIHSAISGRVAMFLSRETAGRLASMIVGQGEAITNESLTDTFAEILNTVAGRVASGLVQSSYSFDLSIPRVVFGKIKAPEEGGGVQSCYQIEFGCVCLSFSYT